MRRASWVMSGLFLGAAGLQLNDPDPWLWMPVYGLGALLSVLFARGRLPATEALIAGVAVLALALWSYLAHVRGRASLLQSEPGNETLGLVITGAWILLLARTERRRS